MDIYILKINTKQHKTFGFLTDNRLPFLLHSTTKEQRDDYVLFYLYFSQPMASITTPWSNPI